MTRIIRDETQNLSWSESEAKSKNNIEMAGNV